jgi:hypothetical protein
MITATTVLAKLQIISHINPLTYEVDALRMRA